ncbi:MAG: protein kinase [Myxococcaceae bacterium]|nr:protein kinase [Myxococcaceae bacterium]
MAEIFRARYQPAPGVSKQVVIKRILPHYAANQAFVAMFTNEARIAMGLSHGNIAQVFDFGEIDGDWFIAMELVDGQPLSRIMKRAREKGLAVMPMPLAMLVTAEMLKGLHYAHTRLDDQGRPLRIVHRDVSPQNVLVSFEGQVKLVDFGIAKARTAGRQETEAGAVKGKYSYFSPEQARGKELDARADVFAAGIVLYELVCGQLPFQGKLIDALAAVVKGRFPPPRELNPDVSPALEKIILTAMAHEKDQRYESAEAFQVALTSTLYQTAPSFSPSRLAHFMGYLFESELVAEGRPQKLPREFFEQLEVWKKPLPVTAPQSTLVETSAGRGRPAVRTSKAGLEVAASPRTSEVVRAEHGAPTRRWLLLIPVAAMVLTGVGVTLYGRYATFTVQLSSQPPGASVRVDGRPAEPTPVTLSGLSVSAPHRIDVTSVGLAPWSQTVTPRPGAVLALHAELQPLEPPAPEPTADAGLTEPAPIEVPPVAMEAAYPTAPFALDAQVHVLPTSGGVRVPLEPGHAYRVWTEGRVSLGGLLNNLFVDECVYVLEQDDAALARDGFGLAGRKPVTVHHARALTAFITDLKSGDNSGALKLRVQDLATKAVRTAVVDARAASVGPEPGQRFTLSGLRPAALYDVQVRPGANPARTHGERGGQTGRVLFGTQAGASTLGRKPSADDSQRVLEVGKPQRFGGTSWAWFAFPDADRGDNTGTLEVTVTEVAGTGQGLLQRLAQPAHP